jgi:hypothetical protein
MLILDHVQPEQATGKVAEAYAVFPKQVPVPDPLILMSVSPDLTYAQSQVIRHYMTHERLDMGLLAMIRYLTASQLNYDFCIQFNAGLLKMAGGMSDEDLAALKANPQNAPLEESQKALLLFVLKAVKNPEQVTLAEVNQLRELGWRDQDIYDATHHAAGMVAASITFKAFNK